MPSISCLAPILINFFRPLLNFKGSIFSWEYLPRGRLCKIMATKIRYPFILGHDSIVSFTRLQHVVPHKPIPSLNSIEKLV